MSYPELLIADENRRIFEVPKLGAVGMKGGLYFSLSPKDLIPLPDGSELFVLPDRVAIGFDSKQGKFIQLKYNPFKRRDERCYPVAAFIAPGYTVTYNTAYFSDNNRKILPLFSYSAVCWYKGGFYVPAVQVDKDKRQNPRFMDIQKLNQNIEAFKREFPKNRLVHHLARCAAVYGCPAAKNFFLKRYECPLPISPACNARCLGCISLQPSGCPPAVQPRIDFIPKPQEVAQVALYHIQSVERAIVSFGQGCEGEPLMAEKTLLRAVELIRNSTSKGTINLNTNASRPQIIDQLCQLGLDSMRVSINSLRENYYNVYCRPESYRFADVLESINVAKNQKKFVSINYLVMPGFTDNKEEVEELFRFIETTNIDMIQWRNLNYDPEFYFRQLNIPQTDPSGLWGIKELMDNIRYKFPNLRFGYFNPAKESWVKNAPFSKGG